MGKIYPFPKDEKFYPSPLVANYKPIVNLCGIWHNEEQQIFRVPFCSDEHEVLHLKTDFLLQSTKLSDTLYLYFEGIAWSSEVYLNGRLLTVSKDPFQEILIPVAVRWFLPLWNSLEVRMNLNGKVGNLYPRKMLGIHKPCYVLEKSKINTQYIFPKQGISDSTVVFAAYTYEYGYNMTIRQFDKSILNLKQNGVKGIYLPFPLSNKLYLRLAEFGMQVHSQGRKTAFYNQYPPEEIFTLPFWVNKKHQRLSTWGVYVSGTASSVRNEAKASRISVLIIGIIPFVFLTMLKLYDARSFSRLSMNPYQGRQVLDAIRDGNHLKYPFLFFVRIIYFFTTGGFVTFFLYYLKIREWDTSLNIFQERGYLYDFLAVYGWTELRLYTAVLALLISTWLIEHVILTVVASLYRLKDFSTRKITIEITAGFLPSILLLFIGLISFTIQSTGSWL
ncbi:MAG: hypothetical protein NZ108_06330, partial [Bacteroidia bacterium]|nr:hypothetical protein [Bacteroidia bacterium]